MKIMFGERYSSFLLSLVLVSSFYVCQGENSQDIPVERDIEQRIEDKIKAFLKPVDPLELPYLPSFNLYKNGTYDISLTLAEVVFTGLSDELHVKNVDRPVNHGPNQSNTLGITINYGKLEMFAGEYSAGGHFLNMPFTGESYADLSVENLEVSLQMECEIFSITQLEICIKRNSTEIELDVGKSVVYFNDLNPGTDQGELVNTMASSFLPDIVDFFNKNLNSEWHNLFDKIIVGAFNKALCNENK